MSENQDPDDELAFAKAMLRANEDTISDPDFPESLKSYYREQRNYWKGRIADLDAQGEKGESE